MPLDTAINLDEAIEAADAGHAEVKGSTRFTQQHAVAPAEHEQQPGLRRGRTLWGLHRHEALHAALRHVQKEDQPAVQFDLAYLVRIRSNYTNGVALSCTIA